MKKCKFIDSFYHLFLINLFWQCLWNSWILIFTFPKQQTATEVVLKECSEKYCLQKLPCKPAVKIYTNACEGDHTQ